MARSRLFCVHCQASDLAWRKSAGLGAVHSFTLVERAPSPAFKARVPYAIALVDFAPGVRMMMNVEGDPASFAIDAPVRLRESQQLRLARVYPKSLYKEGTGTVLVPRPTTARIGGSPLRDQAVLDWAAELIRTVMLDDVMDTGAQSPRRAAPERTSS